MDSSGQQNTNIQEQPIKQQELVPVQADTFPKKLGLYLGFVSSRITVDKLKSRYDWRAIARTTFFITSALLIICGLLYWKFYLNAMNTKSLSDGGYNYSFTFSRPAKFGMYSNGMRGYATDQDHSAVVGPISGLPSLCGLRGDPYTLAFTVHVYGATRPVCTAQDSQDEQMFMLSFIAQNQYHELLVTYGYTNDAKIYPKLKTIFESITVTK
jgi:hypothetical protein